MLSEAKSIRWLKQRDNFSCGLVMIVNIMKWATKKVNGRQLLKELKVIYKREKDIPEQFVIMALENIKEIRIDKVKENPTIQEIDKHLKSGGAIALGYFWEEDSIVKGHFSLCISKKEDMWGCYYELINDGDLTICQYRREALNYFLQFQYSIPGITTKTAAWFISKKIGKLNDIQMAL